MKKGKHIRTKLMRKNQSVALKKAWERRKQSGLPLFRLKYNKRCKVCGKKFFSIRKDRKYCKKECRYKIRKRRRNKTKWQLASFGRLKKDIFRSKGEKCLICKRKQKLEIHHIDGKGRQFKSSERNNQLKNLTVLCNTCHRLITFINEFLKKNDSKLLQKFLEKYKLNIN